MSAIDKTDNLWRPAKVPMHLFKKNEKNPNKMRPREFDLLCDNFEQTGWTDPCLCRPSDFNALEKILAAAPDDEAVFKAMEKQKITLNIVGGHHRYDAGSYLGFSHGPATVIMDAKFDADKEQFQIVRMNAIHGRLDPQAFLEMYNGLSEKYSDEILQDAFGFAEEAEFKKLIAQTAKGLPKQMQQAFKDAAKEVKTIDGLSKLLNEMFKKYGDTLPFGYMVFDHGGQRSVWLRIEGKTMKALDVIANICVERSRTFDDVVGTVLQLIAKGDSKDFIDAIIADTPEVVLPDGLQTQPTKDNIAMHSELVDA